MQPPPTSRTRPWRWWASAAGAWAPAVGLTACIVAWGAIFVDVETVLVTGPIIFVLGLVCVGASVASGDRWSAIAGWGFMAAPVLCTALIVINDWGPDEAQLPLLVIGAVVIVAGSPAAALAWRHGTRRAGRAPRYQPWQCQRCGYALIGLRSDTCPECGEPYDKTLVPTAQP